jgi:hypothetical protein
MSVTYARITFPFRVLSFFTLYIIINTILYNSDVLSDRYLSSRIPTSISLHPNLPAGTQNLAITAIRNLTAWSDFHGQVQGWIITADVFIVFLFVAMILGLLLTVPHVSFLIAVLHFLAVVLLTHMFCEGEEVSFLIGAVWIGVILPLGIELWQAVRLFVFKTDFYYVRE